MDLELLRTFLEVNRVRHFGRAAEALHLTQAAVSARIKQLEKILGVGLFDRVHRDIRLTPEGHRLVRHADVLLAEWRITRQDVAAGSAREQLTLGGSLRLWDVLLQDWLHLLRRQRPGLAIMAESHTPELLTRLLLDGVLDLAFMLEPAQLELLQIEPVAQVELVLVSTQPGMTANETLSRDDYLMVDWGLAHSLEHRRLYPNVPEPHTWLAQAKMALAYMLELNGSAYLPRSMILQWQQSGRLHLVDDAHVLRRQAYAVYPLRGAKNQLIQEILRLTRDRISTAKTTSPSQENS